MTAPVFRGQLRDFPPAPPAAPTATNPFPPPPQAPPPVLSVVGEIYTRYAAAALMGLMCQRDSIICDENELAKRAYAIADQMMQEYQNRTGNYIG